MKLIVAWCITNSHIIIITNSATITGKILANIQHKLIISFLETLSSPILCKAQYTSYTIFIPWERIVVHFLSHLPCLSVFITISIVQFQKVSDFLKLSWNFRIYKGLFVVLLLLLFCFILFIAIWIITATRGNQGARKLENEIDNQYHKLKAEWPGFPGRF